MLVASLEATAGSVIAKQDRISPAMRGIRYFYFCSSLAYNINVSLFKVILVFWIHVARIWCRTIEYFGSKETQPHQLTNECILQVSQSLTVDQTSTE